MKDAPTGGHTMRLMFEDSPIGMCSVLADGTILRANPAFTRLMGISAGSVLTAFTGEVHALLAESLQTVLTGEKRSFKMEACPGRGSPRWCQINGVAMAAEASGDVMLHVMDVSEARQREIDLRERAERDSLTGLHNRLSFHRCLGERLARESPGTLLMLDLDGFKKVNDRYGHQRGDDVLVAVATAIVNSVRATDVVARLGGDEFAILLDTEIPASTVGASLIRRINIAAAVAAGMPNVSASIGIAKVIAGFSVEETLARVDQAMYAAKRSGKGRCVEASAVPSNPAQGMARRRTDR
ncbi:MAG: hypothetical protein NVS4B13_01920 [Candidatus Elarobacter sp.]